MHGLNGLINLFCLSFSISTDQSFRSVPFRYSTHRAGSTLEAWPLAAWRTSLSGAWPKPAGQPGSRFNLDIKCSCSTMNPEMDASNHAVLIAEELLNEFYKQQQGASFPGKTAKVLRTVTWSAMGSKLIKKKYTCDELGVTACHLCKDGP